jgi:hypothetical protein
VQALLNPATFEKAYLSHLANVFEAQLTMSIDKMLSGHAENETYICAEEQEYLVVRQPPPLHTLSRVYPCTLQRCSPCREAHVSVCLSVR